VSATGESEMVDVSAAPAVSGALDTKPMTEVTVRAATTPTRAFRRKTPRDEPLARCTPSDAGT